MSSACPRREIFANNPLANRDNAVIIARMDAIAPRKRPRGRPRTKTISRGLALAFDAVGGGAALARLLTEAGLPITHQAVTLWSRVPHDKAREIERVTGIPRHELRPDLWDRPIKEGN